MFNSNLLIFNRIKNFTSSHFICNLQILLYLRYATDPLDVLNSNLLSDKSKNMFIDENLKVGKFMKTEQKSTNNLQTLHIIVTILLVF